MESSAQPHDIAELFHTCQSFPAPHRTLTARPSLGRDRMRRQPQPEEEFPRPFSRAAEATRQSKSLHLWLATARMPSSGSGAPNCAKMAQFRPRNRHGGGREGIRRGKGEALVLSRGPFSVPFWHRTPSSLSMSICNLYTQYTPLYTIPSRVASSRCPALRLPASSTMPRVRPTARRADEAGSLALQRRARLHALRFTPGSSSHRTKCQARRHSSRGPTIDSFPGHAR